MFDKLIVSEPEGADFKSRRNYFMVSSLAVGALFLAAVVISIFASDYGLGNGGFELTELIAPPEMAAVDPEPPRPQLPATQSRSTNQLPMRQVNMQSLAESPIVPKDISDVPNVVQARPDTRFQLGPIDTNPANSNGIGRDNTGPGTGTTGLVGAAQVTDTTPPSDPPAVKAPPVRTVSGGVVNGNASYLPKPNYPAAAVAINAQGTVDVQVMIDESGKVVSAKAVSGHPLLRLAAENAARNARFTPTYLSKVAVKVTGVIVYNFVRS